MRHKSSSLCVCMKLFTDGFLYGAMQLYAHCGVPGEQQRGDCK